MSILPTKDANGGADVIGNVAETAYQIGRASQGKEYKPMGQEEIVEPVGRWVGKVTGSRVNRGRE